MTARVCPVHGEWSDTGICRWREEPKSAEPPVAEPGCDCGARPGMSHLSSCALMVLRRELRADLERAVPGAEELDAKLRKQFSPEPPTYGESPGASALRDAQFLATCERKYLERIGYLPPATTYVGVPVVVDPHSDRDGPVLVSWTLIEKTDEAYGWRLEWTAPVPPGPELNADKKRRLAEEHAALRWERVARRWATKHPSPWKKLDPADMDAFTQWMVDAFLRWFYGLEPKP